MLLSKEKLEALSAVLQQTVNALIVTHEFPDMDAVGSSLALYHQLKARGIQARVWIPQGLGPDFAFLPGRDKIERSYPFDIGFDTVFALDASHASRVREFSTIPTEGIAIVNIDHHPDNSQFGHLNIVEDISSVGELLYTLFTDLNWDISKDIATCLYAAISFDTGRFAYSNVSAHTHEAAAKCIKCGADSYHIFQSTEENKTVDDLALMRLAIERLVINKHNKFAYTSIPLGSPQGTIKIIDVIRQLGVIDVAIAFQELEKHRVKINLRSKGNIDVSAFANGYGGGGHKKASGIVMPGNLDAVISKITEDYIDYLLTQ